MNIAGSKSLDSILEKLKSSSHPNNKIYSDRIEILKKSSSSSTELIGDIGNYLLKIKVNDPRISNLIGKEIEIYIANMWM